MDKASGYDTLLPKRAGPNFSSLIMFNAVSNAFWPEPQMR